MNANDLVSDGADEDLARHIIEFDPRAASHYKFAAEPGSSEAEALAAALKPDPIPWPDDLAPAIITITPAPAGTDPLPEAAVLIVTYTVAEGYALADVLTPGLDTSAWTPCRNGWDELKKTVKKGAPSLVASVDRAASWAVTKVGTTRIVVVKSALHPSTDGSQLPIRALWKQMIEQVKPKLVITTGTAGGIGAETLLGDVIVSKHVQWDCTKTFANAPFAHASYVSNASLHTGEFHTAQTKLIPLNAAHLPAATRTPKIVDDTTHTEVDVISTDFFAFDDAANSYGLRTYNPKAHAVEMDDAALGLACTDIASPPAWCSVRNASDPQMTGGDLATEKKQAAAIYEKCGYWTSIGSVITCWALAAKLGS